MADSKVVEAIKRQREEIARNEVDTLKRLTRLWLPSYKYLKEQSDTLMALIQKRRDEGKPVEPEYIFSQQRYKTMLDQAQHMIWQYNKAAAGIIGGAEVEMTNIGEKNAKELVNIAEPDDPMWTRVNKQETRIMAGMTANGSPLSDLLDKSFSETKDEIVEKLMVGIATGQGVDWIARQMEEAGEVPLERALLIARTEINRAYREANLEQMRSSNAIIGYRRMCYPPTACFACLMLDGEYYDKNSGFSDHPNGKCTVVPVTKHYDPINDPGWERGPEWFEKQSEETQRKLMGATRYELWKSGGVNLRNMVFVKENSIWGGSPSMLRIDSLGAFDFVGTTAADGTVITGYSNHSLNRLQERGVTIYGIEEALTKPIKIEDKSRPNDPAHRLTGEHAILTINPNSGKIITMIRKGKK